MLGFVSTVRPAIPDQGSLCGLSPDTETTVQAVRGPKMLQDRLKSIGIVAGSHIKVLRSGCPVVVHSEGGRFCLRKEDASQIRVEPVSP